MNAFSQLSHLFMPAGMVIPAAVLLTGTAMLCFAVGLRRLGRLLLASAVALLLVPALLGPVLDELLANTPLWFVLLLVVALGCYLLRLVFTLFLGKEGAGNIMSALLIRCCVLLWSATRALRRTGPRGLLLASVALGAHPRARGALLLALSVLLALLAGGHLRSWVDDGAAIAWAASPAATWASATERPAPSSVQRRQPPGPGMTSGVRP